MVDADADEARTSAPPVVAFAPSSPPAEEVVPLPTVEEPPAAPENEGGGLITTRAAAVVSALVRGDDARATFEVELVREIRGAERFRAMLLLTMTTMLLFALVIVR